MKNLKLKTQLELKKDKQGFFLSTALTALLLVFALTLCTIPYPEKVSAGKGSGVTVFVIDTGIDQVFVEEGAAVIDPAVSHGSIVSRIIRDDAPGITLIPHSVEGEGGELREDLYLAGLRRVIDYQRGHPRERVLVNISLAFSEYRLEHHRLIKELYQSGVMVIAAAGNDGAERVVYPAGFGEVVAVANADTKGRAGSSNYGLHIDLSAPGDFEHITRIYFSRGISYSRLKKRGSSFSAPGVTGLLARILVDHPELSPWEGLKIIEEKADEIADPLYKAGLLGAGVINRERSLGGGLSFFQKDWFRPVIILLIIAGAGMAALYCKYGITAIFLMTLFFLVGLPLLLIVSGQLYSLLQRAGAGPGDLIYLAISFAASMGAAYFLTGWSKAVVLLSYTLFISVLPGLLSLGPLLFPGGLIELSARDIILAWWLPALLLFLLESLLLLLVNHQINRGKRGDRLIRFLGSHSKKVDSLARKGLILMERGESEVREEIKAALTETESRRKRASLIRLLSSLEEPPVEFLLSWGVGNTPSRGLIIESLLARGQIILPVLFRVLGQRGEEEQWLAGILLRKTGEKIPAERKGELIEFMTRALSGRDYDREILLLALSDFKQEAARAVPRVMGILKDDGNNWLRFQALRTLAAIHSSPEELLPLLEELKKEEPEPIRSEAGGLIREISGK